MHNKPQTSFVWDTIPSPLQQVQDFSNCYLSSPLLSSSTDGAVPNNISPANLKYILNNTEPEELDYYSFSYPQQHSPITKEDHVPQVPSPPPSQTTNMKQSLSKSSGSLPMKATKNNSRCILIGEELLKMRQNDAARMLGIAPSTFSKRWRQALPNRKWPYRQHEKLQRSIRMLKALAKKGKIQSPEHELKKLMQEKDENLCAASILVFNDDIADDAAFSPPVDDSWITLSH